MRERERKTLMAVATASPTRPGSDCHIPKATEGILAPVFNWKNEIGFAGILEPEFFATKCIDSTLIVCIVMQQRDETKWNDENVSKQRVKVCENEV